MLLRNSLSRVVVFLTPSYRLLPYLAEDTTLESFFAGTKGKFKHPMVTAWVNELDAERAESRAIKK